MQKHRYSIETLYHFACDCGKWWSIGDYQKLMTAEITCPNCGTKAPTEPLTTTACSDQPNGDFIEEEISDSCKSGVTELLTEEEMDFLLGSPEKEPNTEKVGRLPYIYLTRHPDETVLDELDQLFSDSG